MSPSSRPQRGPSPVVAGSQPIATLLLCTAAFAGVGALFAATVPLGIAGLSMGFAAGLVAVIERFSDV